MAEKKYIITDWSIEQPISLKKITTLVVSGINKDELQFTINSEGNLVVSNESKQLSFVSYSALKYLTTDTVTKFDLIANSVIDNTTNVFDEENIKKKKVSGTKYNDEISINLDEEEAIKNLTINGGAGSDNIDVTNGYKSLKINAGNGDNTISVGDAGSVSIKSGSGNDTIDVSGSEKFSQSINAGSGNNDISVDRDGETTITTGLGDDEIEISSDGKKTVKAGAGDNVVTIEGVGKVTVTCGVGDDTISVSDNTSSTTIKAGSGDNTITLENLQAKSSITTGNGSDIISVSTKSSSTITSSGGDNNITLENNRVGKTTITTGSGNDVIDISGKTDSTIKAGDGDNVISITDGGKNVIKTGKDNDNINVSGGVSTTISAGAGTNTIFVDNMNPFGAIVIKEENVSAKNTIEFAQELDSFYKITQKGTDLVITNTATESSLTIQKYYKEGAKSAKYEFKIDDETWTLDELIASTYSKAELSRGKDAVNLEFSPDVSTSLILTDTLTGNALTYIIKSLSGTQTASVEHLANGRLYIKGDYLQIDALSGQSDDIILLGTHNTLNTGDLKDTVRLGYVIDGYGVYYYDEQKQSDFNTINLGDGDDYLTFLGTRNRMITGNDNDLVADMYYDEAGDWYGIEYNKVDGQSVYADYSRYINGNFGTGSVDNKVGWHNQGAGGGDCRLFALIESLSASKENFKLSDYVTITKQPDDSYNVTFDKYTGTNKTFNVALSDLDNFENCYGDLDVVLADYAMNKLIVQNQTYDMNVLKAAYEGQTVKTKVTVQQAYYNTISNYFFGTPDSTMLLYKNDYDVDFEEELPELWAKYKAGTITNISIGVSDVKHNFKLGIISGHAYSLADLTEDYVALINPWDSADILKLDLDTFYDLKPSAIIYGVDYYERNLLIEQGLTTANQSDEYFAEINSSIQSWINSGSEISNVTFADSQYDQPSLVQACLDNTIEGMR